MNRKQITTLTLMLLALVALTLAACGASATPTPPPLAVALKAGDIMFDTTAITAKVGQPVTVTITNTGALEHSFVIDALDVKIEHVQPGQTGTATFTPTEAGTFDFYCNVAGHKEAGMKGTLTISQ